MISSKKTIVFILFLLSISYSINTNDLPYPRSKEVISIITEIAPIESLCQVGKTFWQNTKQKDSVKKSLYNALENTAKIKNRSFERKLLEGILWLHLYQVEVDSAYFKVKKIAANLMQRYPNQFESSWLKGINYIHGAKIDSGFQLFEKIRKKHENLPDNFIRDYINLSELIFLTNTKNPENILKLNQIPLELTTLQKSEKTPSNYKWSVYSEADTIESFPKFTFSADFNLKRNFKINYCSFVSKTKKFKVNIPLKPQIQRELKDPLFYNPNSPPIKMSMNILVDKIINYKPLDSYIFDFIYKKYDEVTSLRSDNKNMLILKCRNKKVSRLLEDEYIAFFIFDRPLNLFNKNLFEKSINSDYPSTVRYTVVLKTSASVEDKTDALLYEVAEKLMR